MDRGERIACSLDLTFSFAPVILGVFAAIAGSGLLAADEEGGQLDLILAHPVSRSDLFFGRLVAFAIATAAIVFLGWVGLVIPALWLSFGLSPGQLALPFLPLLAQTTIYGSVALLFSTLLPARRYGAMVAGLVLVASYTLTSMANLHPDLATIARLLPYHYYQGGSAIDNLNVGWLIGLLSASSVLVLLSWWRFLRKDVRVVGEGSWSLPWQLRPSQRDGVARQEA